MRTGGKNGERGVRNSRVSEVRLWAAVTVGRVVVKPCQKGVVVAELQDLGMHLEVRIEGRNLPPRIHARFSDNKMILRGEAEDNECK